MKKNLFITSLVLISLTSCSSSLTNRSFKLTERSIASQQENSCLNIVNEFNLPTYKIKSLSITEDDSHFDRMSIIIEDLSYFIREGRTIPHNMSNIAKENIDTLEQEEILKDPLLLKLLTKDSKKLYTQSRNFEYSLKFLKDIGLTKKILSLVPEIPSDKKYGYHFKEFELEALPTDHVKDHSQELSLTGRTLYHATRNKDAWNSIRARKDGNLNALIKYTGPGKGFFFTDKAPKRQYGDYVIAFQVSDTSIYKEGDKPGEFFLTNGNGVKVIDYNPQKVNEDSQILNLNLNEILAEIKAHDNLFTKENETIVKYMDSIRKEYLSLTSDARIELIKSSLIDINDETTDGIYNFLKLLELNSKEIEVILQQTLSSSEYIRKKVLKFFDIENVERSLRERYLANTRFNNMKIPRSTKSDYYKNQTLLYKEGVLDIDSFERDSFNHSSFLIKTMENMTIQERGDFLLSLLEEYPKFANRISSLLEQQFIVNNQDYIKILAWYIDNSKEVFIKDIFKTNPQPWSNPDMAQLINRSENLMELWQKNKDLYGFETPLKKVMD